MKICTPIHWTRVRVFGAHHDIFYCDRCYQSVVIPHPRTPSDLRDYQSNILKFDHLHSACLESYLPPISLPLL